MRRPLLLFVILLLVTTVGLAKDVYLSVGGSVGVFRTDLRIFNPSQTKDISVQAYLLKTGNADNSAVAAKTITVGKRQMVVYDDVVTSLFNDGGLAAIRLKSDDEFVATQRIYAQASNGTLGQFVPGLDVTGGAKKNGVLIQLKSNGSFRTNIGAVNPNAAAANVTWRLYDRNNNLVATGSPIVMPPYAVIGPTNMASTFFFNPGNADLSDSWVSYTSDQPIFAYASVVDNGTTDPTFITMSEDTSPPATPTPTAKVFSVELRSGSITLTPAASGLRAGDTVTFRIRAIDVTHGFQLSTPAGEAVVAAASYSPSAGTIERTFTLQVQGTYTYFCTIPTCSSGHDGMIGTFDVETPGGDPGRGY